MTALFDSVPDNRCFDEKGKFSSKLTIQENSTVNVRIFFYCPKSEVNVYAFAYTPADQTTVIYIVQISDSSLS